MPPTVILPCLMSQNRAASRETVVLPPPEGPTSAVTSPLLRGEGHVLQHCLAAVIGEAHMVEGYVAAAIAQRLAAGLHRAVQNLVHALNVACSC